MLIVTGIWPIEQEHVWERLSDEDFLERIGAARLSDQDKILHPTAAGLLMFGEEYKILYEFPEYFLDYREVLDPSIRWTDRLQSSSGDWSGNLFDFFFRIYIVYGNSKDGCSRKSWKNMHLTEPF